MVVLSGDSKGEPTVQLLQATLPSLDWSPVVPFHVQSQQGLASPSHAAVMFLGFTLRPPSLPFKDPGDYTGPTPDNPR